MTETSFPEPLDPLTERETEVLRLLAAGNSNKEVAAQLVITVGTVKWYVQQIYGKLNVNRRNQAIARARELNLLEAPLEGRSSSRQKSNIPVQTTAFIGRRDDIDETKRMLLEEQDCRLLTILGPGGIGKSRLALAVASEVLSTMPDGVYFVPLAPLSDAADIVPAIAQAINFTFYGKTDPTEQLLGYLQSKKLLLVLDNYEHLRDGAELLPLILKHAPHLLLLTTSRERLNLQEEWIYNLVGLTYPSVDDMTVIDSSAATIETFQAVQLFSQRARQADTGFVPIDEIVDIARICQLVEGMPLALELAAGWVRTLTCNEIASEIERNLDFLTTSHSNVITRHQSLRVVIEQTWHHLSPEEKSVLSKLSVFRGGCTRHAAQAVTGATLSVMSSLIDKALLRRTDTGRYEIHELIRQFSAEQLEQDSEQVKQVQEQHRKYFVSFLEARTADVKGNRQKEALNEIRADIDNLRLAWRESVARRDAQAVDRAAECLFVFYLYTSGHFEGQIVFKEAFAAFVKDQNVQSGDDISETLIIRGNQEDLAGYLLACQGYFLGRTVDPFTGETLIEQALKLIRRAEAIDRYKEGFALQWLGWMVAFQGKSTTEILEYIDEALTVAIEIGDRCIKTWALINQANNLSGVQPLQAEEVYKRGMVICEETGDQSMFGYYCHTRSDVNMNLGRYAVAQQLADEAVRIFEELESVLGLGYALRIRGELASTLGDYEQGIHDLQQAAENFSEVRTEFNVIWAQCHLAKALRMKGDYVRSEQLCRQVLEAAIAYHYKTHVAKLLVELGCLAYAQGKLERVEQYYLEALSLIQKLGSKVQLANVCAYLAQVMVDVGEQRYDEAKQYFQQALQIAMRLQLAPVALYVCVGVAKLKALLGETEQAVGLAALAEQHESSSYETRELAHQIRTQLSSSVSASQGVNRNDDLWTTVNEILSEMDV